MQESKKQIEVKSRQELHAQEDNEAEIMARNREITRSYLENLKQQQKLQQV